MEVGKERFLVRGLSGKKPLRGSIPVGGAKNAALKLFAAALLHEGETVLENVPDIEDVRQMATLIEELGGVAERLDVNAYRVSGKGVRSGAIDPAIAKRFRASVVLIGPLLARFGEARLPHPGGDVIGARPIDFFVQAFEKMGATMKDAGEEYVFTAPKNGLRPAEIFFPFQSVTATEAALMAATLVPGETVIKNAAMEPEIEDLAKLLMSFGADISGAGSTTIVIRGGAPLSAPVAPHVVMPDRLEAGSFLILGALAADELTITDCNPRHLESLFELLRRSGVSFSATKDSIMISGNGSVPNERFTAVDVRTHEYPGFPTDLQAPMTVYLTQVSGSSAVQETIFDGRLNYTQDLVAMGADIKMWNPHRIEVNGPRLLSGRELEGPDIRAGLSFLWAALIARGDSVINSVHHIDRGYEAIEKRLSAIGAQVERVR